MNVTACAGRDIHVTRLASRDRRRTRNFFLKFFQNRGWIDGHCGSPYLFQDPKAKIPKGNQNVASETHKKEEDLRREEDAMRFVRWWWSELGQTVAATAAWGKFLAARVAWMGGPEGWVCVYSGLTELCSRGTYPYLGRHMTRLRQAVKGRVTRPSQAVRLGLGPRIWARNLGLARLRQAVK
jgi:hypothetical protein